MNSAHSKFSELQRVLRSLFLGLAALGVLAAPWPSAGLILDTGDGTGNTEAPPDDPGWAYVGKRWGGPTVIYVGNRWVLTANHVGAGVVEFDGSRYDPIAGSVVRFVNEKGLPSDLIAFRIESGPDLPPLPLREFPARSWEAVILIGTGNSRAGRVTHEIREGLWRKGYEWGSSRKQWGTNTIIGTPRNVRDREGETHAIATTFNPPDDPLSSSFEAQAAHGDSGGAMFARRNPSVPSEGWALAGVIFSVESPPNRPAQTSFYGDVTLSVDLHSYRDQIISLIRPACSNELDDDQDGAADFPEDRGCSSATDSSEIESSQSSLFPSGAVIAAGAMALAAGALSTGWLWRQLRRRRRHA